MSKVSIVHAYVCVLLLRLDKFGFSFLNKMEIQYLTYIPVDFRNIRLKSQQFLSRVMYHSLEFNVDESIQLMKKTILFHKITLSLIESFFDLQC